MAPPWIGQETSEQATCRRSSSTETHIYYFVFVAVGNCGRCRGGRRRVESRWSQQRRVALRPLGFRDSSRRAGFEAAGIGVAARKEDRRPDRYRKQLLQRHGVSPAMSGKAGVSVGF